MFQSRKTIVAFGKHIREAREACDLDIPGLCKKLDLSREIPPESIRNIELGAGWIPETDAIISIATALDLDPDDLMARAGRVSPGLQKIITQHPAETVKLLKAIKNLSAVDILALAQQAENASSI